MNRRIFLVGGMAALAAAPRILRAQGLVICPKCGREAKSGETVCSHCGAKLPLPRIEAPVQAAAPAAPDRGEELIRLASGALADDLKQARAIEEKEPGVALCYYQNALALIRLLPEGRQPKDAGAQVLQGNAATMSLLRRGWVPCRKCKGTGKYQIDLTRIGTSSSLRSVEGVACPMCKGAGGFAGYRELEKVKLAILQGRRAFEERQMVAGDVRLGRSLVPSALDALLNTRQRALVMTAMPLPCSACQLTGRQPCTACKGTGWVTCDYPDCDDGVLKETTRKADKIKSIRMNDDVKKTCPQCKGMGEIACKVCEGSGSVACKRCNGSGLAPRCTRCSGTGLAPCSKCKGTGEVKGAPCPDCKGESVVLCSTCHGEGAVAR